MLRRAAISSSECARYLAIVELSLASILPIHGLSLSSFYTTHFLDVYQAMCTRQYLYIILPYFNYCGFQRRQELFIQFVKRMKLLSNVRIVVSEVIGPAQLPILGVFKHLKFQTESHIWLKENLVNLGVRALPPQWEYMAWIDADLSFLNRTWVTDTLSALGETYDVVQLFQTVVNLGPKNEALKIDKSFGHMFKDSGTPLIKSDKYGFWHPGYAWACTKFAWEKMGGLIEFAILGSADRHMAYALVGRVLESAPGNIHPNYAEMLTDFQKSCHDLQFGYIPGTLLHHWHGSMKNRKYRERWDILTQNAFDPLKDIGVCNGLIQLTPVGHRMDHDLIEYFVGRKEDDKLTD